MGKWSAFDSDLGCCGTFSCLTNTTLLLQILSCLEGLDELFRMRLVCKSWDDAVVSPLLTQLYKVSPQHNIWIFFFFAGTANLDYGISLNQPRLWLPRKNNRLRECAGLRLHPPGWISEHCCIICASGGLVCAVDDDDLKLGVGNPLTGHWITLYIPSKIPNMFISEATMIVNSASYELVIFYNRKYTPGAINEAGDAQWLAMHYRSNLGTWSKTNLQNSECTFLTADQLDEYWAFVSISGSRCLVYNHKTPELFLIDLGHYHMDTPRSGDVRRLPSYKGENMFVSTIEGGDEVALLKLQRDDDKLVVCSTFKVDGGIIGSVRALDIFFNELVGDLFFVFRFPTATDYICYDLAENKWTSGSLIGQRGPLANRRCGFLPSLTAKP